jgi:hypothetical protein
MTPERTHLLFFKLSDATEQKALWAALMGEGVHVLGPADAQAEKAWDAAVVLHGHPARVQEALMRLHEAVAGLSVAVTKGWSFTPVVQS